MRQIFNPSIDYARHVASNIFGGRQGQGAYKFGKMKFPAFSRFSRPFE